jgi:hypothetical protein
MSYTINKSIIVNHHTQNSPIGGVAVFIELVEMDGVVLEKTCTMPPLYNPLLPHLAIYPPNKPLSIHKRFT